MEFKDKGIFFSNEEIKSNDDYIIAIEEEKAERSNEGVIVYYDYISSLGPYSLRKYNLKLSPYRIKIESEGRFGGTAFYIHYSFLDEKKRKVDFKHKAGCVYSFFSDNFIVSKEQYELISSIEELNKIKRDVSARGVVFNRIKMLLPEDSIYEKSMLDIEILKVDKIGLDIFNAKSFLIAPEIITKDIKIDSNLSEEFKKDFVSKGLAGKGRKIFKSYIVYSQNVKKILNFIKILIQKIFQKEEDFFIILRSI